MSKRSGSVIAEKEPKESSNAEEILQQWIVYCFSEQKLRKDCMEISLREKMKQRLQSAIDYHPIEKSEDVCVSQIIENILFWRWYYLHPASYRQRCRQIEFNLRCNGINLLTRYSPSVICSMPTKKLAEGSNLDKWREDYRNRRIRDLKPLTPLIKEKSLFQCPKCKQYNTTYYMMQTRSADEPMTCFVTCQTNGCNIRFRRS